MGGVEDAAQVAGVVVEEFGDREDVDGDADGVVLGAAGGDEDGGQLELLGHAPELALAVLGGQVAAPDLLSTVVPQRGDMQVSM